MSNRAKVAAIFWLHFFVAAASHIFVVLMIGGVVSVLISAPALGFWVKGLLLGSTFYTAMYAINHVTNTDGFCILTDLENFYREKESMDQIGPFSPRFYKKCSDLYKKVVGLVKRGAS